MGGMLSSLLLCCINFPWGYESNHEGEETAVLGSYLSVMSRLVVLSLYNREVNKYGRYSVKDKSGRCRD